MAWRYGLVGWCAVCDTTMHDRYEGSSDDDAYLADSDAAEQERTVCKFCVDLTPMERAIVKADGAKEIGYWNVRCILETIGQAGFEIVPASQYAELAAALGFDHAAPHADVLTRAKCLGEHLEKYRAEKLEAISRSFDETDAVALVLAAFEGAGARPASCVCLSSDDEEVATASRLGVIEQHVSTVNGPQDLWRLTAKGRELLASQQQIRDNVRHQLSLVEDQLFHHLGVKDDYNAWLEDVPAMGDDE